MSRLPISAIAAAILILVTGTRAAHADSDNLFADAIMVSPGIKVGYTFGDGGGFTFGAEVTVMQGTGPELSAILAHGPALNLGWSRGGTFHLRAGWQLVSWLVGIEGGPALIWRDGQARFGFGVTPWIGGIVVPYYTYTFVPGARSFDEAGMYLKLPLCPGCEGVDGDDDDDDIFD
jgi:hypothetical protein